MKFRNFDKIGLTTDKTIKEFLGERWLEHLQREEASLRITLERDWHVRSINPNINLENTVCLINAQDKYDKVLLCIVQPSLTRNEDDIVETCYCLQADNRLMTADYNRIFKTEEVALQMADSLYGLSSSDEISAKLRGEDEFE